jgi:hypothetical protein
MSSQNMAIEVPTSDISITGELSDGASERPAQGRVEARLPGNHFDM